MKELRVKFHSVVDVITNSSTVVYTGCKDGAIEAIKEIVDSILKAGGSDKTSDDLYEFSVVPSDSVQEYAADYISENPDSVGKDEDVEIDYKEAGKIVDEMLANGTLKKFVDDHYIMGDCAYYTDDLVMKCKVPEAEEFMSKIYGLFWHEGSYDG